jgi:hypothetical protein
MSRTTNLAFVNENLEIQWLNKASADSVSIEENHEKHNY